MLIHQRSKKRRIAAIDTSRVMMASSSSRFVYNSSTMNDNVNVEDRRSIEYQTLQSLKGVDIHAQLTQDSRQYVSTLSVVWHRQPDNNNNTEVIPFLNGVAGDESDGYNDENVVGSLNANNNATTISKQGMQQKHLEAIWNLRRLKALQLHSYPFPFLSNNTIGRLATLKALELNGCDKLMKIPAQIGYLTNLISLKIANCHQIEALPPEIGRLYKLRTLRIQQCSELRIVPRQIGLLQNLKVLSILWASPDLHLPFDISLLRRLETLSLRSMTNNDDGDSTGRLVVERLPIPPLPYCGVGSRHDGLLLPSLRHLEMMPNSARLDINNITSLDLKKLKSIRLSHLDTTTTTTTTTPSVLKDAPKLEKIDLLYSRPAALFDFFKQPWTGRGTPTTINITGSCIIDSSARGRRGDGPRHNDNNDDDDDSMMLMDDYSRILPGLPRSLTHLGLENQMITSLDGFLFSSRKGEDEGLLLLPPGIRSLVLDNNPILRSADERDQKCLERLLQRYPQLGRLCTNDYKLEHLHPPTAINPGSLSFPLAEELNRYRLFTASTTHLMLFNRCGRSLFFCNNNNYYYYDHYNHGSKSSSTSLSSPVPLSLWPIVLARVRRALWGGKDGGQEVSFIGNDESSMEHSVIFSLLQGPALLGRSCQQNE